MNRIKLNEDWTAAVIGWLSLLITLFKFTPAWPSFGWKNRVEFSEKIVTGHNLILLSVLFVFILFFVLLAFILKSSPVKKIVYGYGVIFVITIVALIIGGNGTLKSWGLEPVIFSLLIGLAISNTIKIPVWLRESLSTELFTKIGLVILGANVLFTDIIKSGGLGVIQALIVVTSVWYFSYWLCKKLKIDNELTMMLSSAVSICGVSAAIATAGAIKGDSKKLSYVISLVLITALPMIVLMPYAAGRLGLSQEVTGAWIGGTIDTTGAVVAADTLVGDAALKTSTIVKFSQNVLLGFAAFFISLFWTYSKNNSKDTEKPTLKVIWERFPKFVIGFIFSSLVFSFVISSETLAGVKDISKNLQSFWFALAFTSIGLETNFRDLIKLDNGKPVIAFLGAQLFNVFITLIVVYFLFG